MRCLLCVSIVASLTACFDPDFNQKPCENQAGCPPSFTCVTGRCIPAQRCTSQDPTCDNGLMCNVVAERCESPDMAQPTPDMATPGPKLGVPSSCLPATVTLSSFYASIIPPNCAYSGCHVAGATSPNFGPDSTTFYNSVVGKSANRPMHPTLNFVTAGKLDDSFLLYKITGQQTKVQNGLAPMPYNKQLLPETDQCTLINWVVSGAGM